MSLSDWAAPIASARRTTTELRGVIIQRGVNCIQGGLRSQPAKSARSDDTENSPGLLAIPAGRAGARRLARTAHGLARDRRRQGIIALMTIVCMHGSPTLRAQG